MSKMSAFINFDERPGYVRIVDDEHDQAIFIKDADHRDTLVSMLCDAELPDPFIDEMNRLNDEHCKAKGLKPFKDWLEEEEPMIISNIDRVLYQDADAGLIDKHYEEGSSWHDHSVEATPSQMQDLLGEPTYTAEHFLDNKIQMEWIVRMEDGNCFTVYDWKYYRELDPDETIPWHIGGACRDMAARGEKELRELIKASR